MSHKIDPREVLLHLNELGYTNISAKQLKDFIIDLKKLIKYDLRNRNQQESTISDGYCLEESSYCECSDDNENSTLSRSGSNKENIKGLSIPSEKPKTVNIQEDKKDKYISLHIYGGVKKKNVLHEHCVHVDNSKTSNQNKLDLVINKGTHTSTTDNTTESTIRSIRPQSRDTQSSKISSKDKKSKVSFIRPCSSKPSFNKCDPVALYHHYQTEWKKTKIPGQDKREDLRWAIREKMLSGPKVELKSRPVVRSCSSCR